MNGRMYVYMKMFINKQLNKISARSLLKISLHIDTNTGIPKS